MSDQLSYAQEKDLVETLVDGLSHAPEALYPSDSVQELADSWLPVYYHDIGKAWEEAGCPEPGEYLPDNNDYDQINIHNLMLLGLARLASDFVSSAIWNNDIGETNTHAEALEALRANYPEHLEIYSRSSLTT